MKRVGIWMTLTGFVTFALVSVSSHVLQSLGYRHLIDETLWLPAHMLGGVGTLVAILGLAVFGVTVLFGEP